MAGSPAATGAAAVTSAAWTGAALTLDPPTQNRSICQTATITATLRDSSGNLAGGVAVTFTRTGANPGPGQNVVTNAGGQAVYAYAGRTQGNDAVHATVAGAPTAAGAATVTWLRPFWNDASVRRVSRRLLRHCRRRIEDVLSRTDLATPPRPSP